jgi:hypothetical protein
MANSEWPFARGAPPASVKKDFRHPTAIYDLPFTIYRLSGFSA